MVAITQRTKLHNRTKKKNTRNSSIEFDWVALSKPFGLLFMLNQAFYTTYVKYRQQLQKSIQIA